jgi:hypothetical protein
MGNNIPYYPIMIPAISKIFGLHSSISKENARDPRITGKGLQGAIAVEVRKMDTGIA